MSASTSVDWPLALAEGQILSVFECDKLLDFDIFKTEDDLLTAFPSTETSLRGVTPTEALSFYPPSPPEHKQTQIITQCQENQPKKENLNGWLEEKIDLPLYESISNGPALVQPQLASYLPSPAVYEFGGYLPETQHATAAAQDTSELLREFESVFVNVELTHLTPPQSPPPPPSAAADELALVEQLVLDSPRSSSDDEWQWPSPRPHARPSDERRKRKKEQNKNAATRYRQKKKAEIEVLLQEEASLRFRHGELKSKCSDVQREIRYLKSLMRDLFKAKGLIK